MSDRPPGLSGVLETALHVEDMGRAADFFRQVLGRAPMISSERLTAFDCGSSSVLLLFARGATAGDAPTPGGVIPGHHGDGRTHMAFAIPATELDSWRAHLAHCGVAIRSEVTWPRGGCSLYFDDPDGNLLELATPGLWPNY